MGNNWFSAIRDLFTPRDTAPTLKMTTEAFVDMILDEVGPPVVLAKKLPAGFKHYKVEDTTFAAQEVSRYQDKEDIGWHSVLYKLLDGTYRIDVYSGHGFTSHGYKRIGQLLDISQCSYCTKSLAPNCAACKHLRQYMASILAEPLKGAPQVDATPKIEAPEAHGSLASSWEWLEVAHNGNLLKALLYDEYNDGAHISRVYMTDKHQWFATEERINEGEQIEYTELSQYLYQVASKSSTIDKHLKLLRKNRFTYYPKDELAPVKIVDYGGTEYGEGILVATLTDINVKRCLFAKNDGYLLLWEGINSHISRPVSVKSLNLKDCRNVCYDDGLISKVIEAEAQDEPEEVKPVWRMVQLSGDTQVEARPIDMLMRYDRKFTSKIYEVKSGGYLGVVYYGGPTSLSSVAYHRQTDSIKALADCVTCRNVPIGKHCMLCQHVAKLTAAPEVAETTEPTPVPAPPSVWQEVTYKGNKYKARIFDTFEHTHENGKEGTSTIYETDDNNWFAKAVCKSNGASFDSDAMYDDLCNLVCGRKRCPCAITEHIKQISITKSNIMTDQPLAPILTYNGHYCGEGRLIAKQVNREERGHIYLKENGECVATWLYVGKGQVEHTATYPSVDAFGADHTHNVPLRTLASHWVHEQEKLGGAVASIVSNPCKDIPF